MNLLIRQGREGMRLKNIARRIYNMHADLFSAQLDYTDLRTSISSYLWKQSRRKGTPFVRLGYGVYAVKTDFAVQLDLFWDLPEYRVTETQRAPAPKHVQLTLFDYLD